ncbi:hypothetical protein HQ585_09100 [candidate division KSB1 bacterium]|nr:hypothetical protein [candidate division KSB1 bacterium]
MFTKSTLLLIDAHVHLYPNYNLNLAFRIGVENLVEAYQKTDHDLPSNSTIVWLLTERNDCRLFDEITETPNLFTQSNRQVRMGKEPGALLIQQEKLPDLYILAGRQLVSTDGLEVLALTGWKKCPDRKYPAIDLIKQVNECGAIPVLNWAPGKWFLKRGKIVRDLIGTSKKPFPFVIGDTPLRHSLWSQPKQMKQAIRKEIKMLAGSDPLPFKGEESMIGTYGNAVQGVFDPDKPVTSVRNILKDSKSKIQIIGKRNNPVKFAWREVRILMK